MLTRINGAVSGTMDKIASYAGIGDRLNRSLRAQNMMPPSTFDALADALKSGQAVFAGRALGGLVKDVEKLNDVVAKSGSMRCI
jgi:hypothetical protein